MFHILKKIIKVNLLLVIFYTPAYSENPLTPLKLHSPRDTMKVFITSMNEYKKGVETQNESKIREINKAIRCLDLEKIGPIAKMDKGAEAAILLKEVIDRVYPVDYNDIPGSIPNQENPLKKWYIPDTEILIVKIEKNNKEEFLFSSDTVIHAGEYFRRTKHLPYLKNSGKGAAYKLPWIETMLPLWSQKKFWLFHIWQWIGLTAAIGFGFFLIYFSNYLFYLLLKLAKKTDTDWDDKIIVTLRRPVGYFIAIGFWYLFLFGSGIEGKPLLFFSFILKVLMGFTFIFFLYKLSDLVVSILRYNAIKSKAPFDDQLIPLLSKTIRIIFMIIGILAAIQNLGVNVMSLVAGLGIGGLAIALAAKDTAANLFGSAMIFMDKPFKIGEHVIVDGKEGLVEEIGFRSTRIRTWEDSVVSIPNSVVANANIENMGARRTRRSVIVLSITYDTSPDKMETFLEGIKYILQKNPIVVKETITVAFRDFGDSSLNVLMQFFLNVNNFADYLDQRQFMFLEVMRLAKELDISFAFPTRTLHVESMPEKKPFRVPKEKSVDDFKKSVSYFKVGENISKPRGSGIFTPAHKEISPDVSI
ncbi:MAG: mechanosensitive ion channel family protein [Leptospiraceae bacterium]|nr:mechanosensitive ion channel family protein [Leptospiraceae bacterium]